MITEGEMQRINELREIFMSNSIQIMGEDVPEELQAEFIGANMANVDALFAIREGEPWRGISDPREIARELLRQSKIGD